MNKRLKDFKQSLNNIKILKDKQEELINFKG